MREILVTTSWDDGHHLDERLAILLKKYGIKGTFYIAPKNQEFNSKDLLTDEQVRKISKDFEIGAHSMTHPRLPQISDYDARREIGDSKLYLEEVTGKKVTSFCYPRGEYRKRHVEIVRELGFTYARTIHRHSFKIRSFLEAPTTIHAYDHWLDVWKVAKFAKFNPIKYFHYYRHWDVLAKAMFDQALENHEMYHLWGHSWEIDKHNDWERLEDVLQYIAAAASSVHFVTNGELVNGKEEKLLIAVPYFPPHIGGSQIYVYNIAKLLQRDFNRNLCVATTGKRGFSKVVEDDIDGIKVYRLPYWFKLSNTPINPLWIFALSKIIKKENISIINAHAPVPGISDITCMLAGKRPFILTYHAGSLHKGKLFSDIFTGLYEQIELPHLLKRANRIICSSDFVRFEFLKKYVDKSLTINPAVDHDIFRPAESKKSLDPSILFVAGLKRGEQYKGLKDLITAVTDLKKTIPSLKLVVVGDGDMKKDYELYAQKIGIQDAVAFRGRLTGNELVEAYQQAHIFVLPTSNDSFAIVVIEAMSCGLPVVSTFVGSIPDLVEDGKTGFLIKPHDLTQLKEKIVLLLENKDLMDKFGVEARKKVEANFSWIEQAKKHELLFESLLEKKRMSVIHVVPYYPPHLGGMEQRVQNLAILESRLGVDVSVISSNIGNPTGTYIQDNVRVTYLRSFELFRTPFAPGLIWKLLTIKKPDLIHLHVVLAFFPEMTALIAKVRSIPYIAHPRQLIMPSEVYKNYPKFLAILSILHDRLTTGLILRGAVRVIALTPDYVEIIHQRYQVPLNKIVSIPNATNFSVVDMSRVGVHNPLRLISVGRISTQKNYPFLLKVAESLKNTHHLNFVLNIVGTGIEQAQLEEESKRLGLTDVVHFVGKKLGKNLEDMYEESDMLVHVSLFEGFCSVFLEAMSKGLPIVATDVIGTRSVVKNEYNGLLTDLAVESVCKAVIRLAADQKLYQQISRNNIRDVQRYDWNTIVGKTIEVYEDSLYKGETSILRNENTLIPGTLSIESEQIPSEGIVNTELPKISIILLTYNSSKTIAGVLDAIYRQKFRNFELICIDSSSSDGTVEILKRYPLRLVTIKSDDFGHGKTRNYGATLAKGKFVVFLTHDSVPENENWLSEIIKPFKDPNIVGVYGKQVPRPEENLLDAYFQINLYGNDQITWEMSNWKQGDNIFSDANSALRKDILLRFPLADNIIVSEDYEWAARLLKSGYKIFYSTTATVIHSHTYNLYTLFKRNFDVGVSYNTIYLQSQFHQFLSKGTKIVYQEILYLYKIKRIDLIPAAIVRDMIRFCAIEAGKNEWLFTKNFKRELLSDQRWYWK